MSHIFNPVTPSAEERMVDLMIGAIRTRRFDPFREGEIGRGELMLVLERDPFPDDEEHWLRIDSYYDALAEKRQHEEDTAYHERFGNPYGRCYVHGGKWLGYEHNVRCVTCQTEDAWWQHEYLGDVLEDSWY